MGAHSHMHLEAPLETIIGHKANMTKSKSKSKKRKLNHHHNSHPRNNPSSQPNETAELTHEEIWDDSALVKSWNDAVAEYEFYHSIHARGEDIDEVLAQHQAVNDNDNHDEDDDDEDEEGEIAEDDNDDDDEADSHSPVNAEPKIPNGIMTAGSLLSEPNANPSTKSNVNGVTAQTGPDQVDPNAHDTNQDQTLENIKMAYYWAGYYSGLYDGQQQQPRQEQQTEVGSSERR